MKRIFIEGWYGEHFEKKRDRGIISIAQTGSRKVHHHGNTAERNKATAHEDERFLAMASALINCKDYKIYSQFL